MRRPVGEDGVEDLRGAVRDRPGGCQPGTPGELVGGILPVLTAGTAGQVLRKLRGQREGLLAVPADSSARTLSQFIGPWLSDPTSLFLTGT
jgi:hypothetical protein